MTSLPAGSAPTVTNVGTPNAAILNIGIPRGADGEDGAPPGGASSTDGGIILADGAIKSPLPAAWPPVLDVIAGAPVGAGVTWSFTKNPANGLISAALDVSALITTFNNQITALTDEIDAQQLSIHVGVLESTDTPDFSMVLARLQQKHARAVLLAPLLLTSGMHVARDLAGDSEGSWKTRLEQAGLSVTPILEGLGESPIFRQIYIEKARKALGES